MKKIILSLAILSISLALFAVPAKRGARTFTQPDGTQIEVFAGGDEFHHFFTDTEGNLLVRNAEGALVKADAQALAVHRAKAANAASARRTRQSAQFVNLAPKGLVILVNFSDKEFKYTRNDFNDMLNKTGFDRDGEIGCVREYFYNQSYGQYQPSFNVVGPVSISKTSSYYAGSNGTDYAYKMIQEACKLVDEQYDVDFTQYDNDGDGEVDFVFVFYAGYGQADYGDSDCVWPHMWWLNERSQGGYANYTITLDGKKVNMYACTNELTKLGPKYTQEAMAGQATFCHEFSHVLGLPDFYDTRDNYDSYKTLGQWDIMDMGAYNNDGITPPAYSAYERFYCGWITPTLLNEDGCYMLPDINVDGQAFLISSTGEHNLNGEEPNPATFYLLENRQKVYGSYDQYLPGSGMLVTKVRYKSSDWENNIPNNYKQGNQGVELIEADGARSQYGDAGDPFPGKNGVTQTAFLSGYNLTNITLKNQVVFFNLNSSEICTTYTEPKKVQWKEFVAGMEEVLLDTDTDEKITGIYTITGSLVGTTNPQQLNNGIYIIRTNKGAKKINILN